MNVNETLHGFAITEKKDVHDIGATLYKMEHRKSGAELAFFDREDTNKTFLIAFRTVPEDDTGVFHILEHSVLCGSDKFPVKEPFVELLKSSLKTFLNAMTYNDKTVYPVSSKNDKDFLNLVNVYMDAVLHPSMLRDEKIFMQEGWHYELSEDGRLSYNGVVYNEMKGAYSSPDDLANERLMNMLYPDSCYSKDSGGNPDFIPSLTYEQFVAMHKKYYHPSNAKIMLDGSVKLDEVLPLLDSFLSEYDRQDMNIEIADQKPISPSHSSCEYEISESEGEEGRARLILGYRAAEFSELEKNLAISVLKDYFTDSNEAPLKKALFERSLCEDVGMYELDGMRRNSAVIDIRNFTLGNEEKIKSVINEVFSAELKAGLDRQRLTATLNAIEFKLRESDFGSMPKGLAYCLTSLDTWLYSDDAIGYLGFEKLLCSLRERLSTDYYEKILAEVFVENSSIASLLMLPSSTLGKRRHEKELSELEKIKSEMPESKIKQIKEKADALARWQSEENSDEAIKALPTLSLSDIDAEPEKIPTEILNIDSVTVLYHPIQTNGIIYSSLIFDATDFDGDEIYSLSLLTALMLNVRTEKRDVLSLQQDIKANLGLLAPGAVTYKETERGPHLAFSIKAHALEKNRDKLIELIGEALYSSVYDDKAVLKKILEQIKIGAEEAMIADGHTVAMGRAEARVSASGAADEYLSGIEAYRKTKKYLEEFDRNADRLINDIKAVAKKLFVRERLTVNLSASDKERLASELVNIAKPGGSAAGSSPIRPLEKKNEAIIIPSRVAYAALAYNTELLGKRFSGVSQVVRMILNYEHLWSEVRVKGGAYGAGIILRKTGRCAFYTYRDPNPKGSISAFEASGDFLRSYVRKNHDLTKLIIGAVGAYMPILTPRSKTELALIHYMNGSSYESEKKTVSEILGTTGSDIVAFADLIDAVCESGIRVTVCGKEYLGSLDVESVIEI